MIKNAKQFYEDLNVPYHDVSIVFDDLNDVVAKTYDLKHYFLPLDTSIWIERVKWDAYHLKL